MEFFNKLAHENGFHPSIEPQGWYDVKYGDMESVDVRIPPFFIPSRFGTWLQIRFTGSRHIMNSQLLIWMFKFGLFFFQRRNFNEISVSGETTLRRSCLEIAAHVKNFAVRFLALVLAYFRFAIYETEISASPRATLI